MDSSYANNRSKNSEITSSNNFVLSYLLHIESRCFHIICMDYWYDYIIQAANINSAVAPTTNMAPYNTYILSIIINCDLYTKTIKYHYIRVITAFAFILKSSVFCDYVQNQAKIARRCARPYSFRMVLLGRIICDLPSSVNKFRYRISTNIE